MKQLINRLHDCIVLARFCIKHKIPVTAKCKHLDKASVSSLKKLDKQLKADSMLKLYIQSTIHTKELMEGK